MARPTKYTPRTVKAILDALRGGNYRETSARLADVSDSTFYEWMARYPDFSDSVEKAEAEAEHAMVATVRQASYDTWTAAAWWMERKFSDRWGRKERHEHSGPGGAPIQHEQRIDLSRLGAVDLDALERLVTASADPPRDSGGEGPS